MACSPEECAALQAQADILSAELVVLNAELAVLNAEIQAANDALELTYWQMWECECESSGSRATGDLSPAEIAAAARRKVESLVADIPASDHAARAIAYQRHAIAVAKQMVLRNCPRILNHV